MTRARIMQSPQIPLDRAYLCQNCRTVGNCSTQCPACGDQSSMLGLAGVLERTEASAPRRPVLVCSDCGYVAFTPEDARDHELNDCPVLEQA